MIIVKQIRAPCSLAAEATGGDSDTLISASRYQSVKGNEGEVRQSATDTTSTELHALRVHARRLDHV